MAALDADEQLRLQQREARAEAAEQRRTVTARNAFEDVRELAYTEIEAAIEAGGGETIGEGAYGPVYGCRLNDGQDVAIKVVGEQLLANASSNPDAEAQIERMFMAEVRTLGHLRHRNVVRLLGYARGGEGRRALVYELLEGGSLHHMIHTAINKPPAAHRISIALDVARGLAHLHGLDARVIGDLDGAASGGDGSDREGGRRVMLHRDIKAANIALNGEGIAKLIDCGLSKTVDDISRSLMSITGGSTLGTPGYIAPEVTSGKFGVVSDIYALGVVLLELLTGRRAAGLVDEIHNAIEDAVEESGKAGRQAFLDTFIHEWVDQSSDWDHGDAIKLLRDLALKCVERRPDRRPQTAAETVMALRAVEEAWAAEHGAVEEEPPAQASSITVEQYQALKAQLDAAHQALRAKEEATAAAAAAAAEQTTVCSISFDECPVSKGLRCAHGHFVSDDYADQYVRTKNEGVVVEDPVLGRIVDLLALQRANRSDGGVYCPQRGLGGCDAPAYTDQHVAGHVSEETFQGYIDVKMRVAERAVHDRAQGDLQAEIDRINEELGRHNIQVSRERLQQELRRQFPNAYQCRQCGFGPIDHMACYDLQAHHGEQRGTGRISNACPQCNWFSSEIAQWPRWDGTLPEGVDATTGEGGVQVRAADARYR
eukprot:CAMPEP_0119527012 /NCGR_PEP_ID=MMETSP1344-20130328/41521_1 /TAXON_ID=236787 /ORGANISM="Florenciella parvula, Strain CCMP2471" /LENGTH=655 /DNA_ID=CAMNT_0007566143 /DNA_START=191 /DNA_END=2155 /DNA_ORIENTATION=+